MSEERLSRIIRELSVELEHSKNRITDLETRSTNLKSEKERAEQYVEEFRANYSLKDAEIDSLKEKINDAYKKASDGDICAGFLDGCTLDARIDIMLQDLAIYRKGKVDSAAEIERLKGEVKDDNGAITIIDEYFTSIGVGFVSSATLGDRARSTIKAIKIQDKEIKRIEGVVSKQQARARKSESEKRKLMGLITKHVKPNRREGTLNPKKLIAEYKAWQKEQKKKTP